MIRIPYDLVEETRAECREALRRSGGRSMEFHITWTVEGFCFNTPHAILPRGHELVCIVRATPDGVEFYDKESQLL